MTTFKEYDWNKLQSYLDSEKQIDVGMKEDWYWTGEELKQESIDKKKIGGISGSNWATPSVLIDNEYIDCYIEKEYPK
jgi:hypothetical protein